MSVIVLKNAKILLGGLDVSGQSNRVALEYSAEALDATVFGASTRTMKGGLKVARATGAGFWEAGTTGVDELLFAGVGTDDVVLTLFPEAIVEGSTSTGAGFAFKVTQSQYTLGGAVGDLLPFDFAVESRGV